MTDFVAQAGVTRLWGAIKKYLSYSNGSKTTLVDADDILITDSAETETANGTTIDKLKRITFADLRAAIGGIKKNQSVSSQTGFSSDTYLTGSFIVFPSAPKVGTTYKLVFDVTKTAAGTATPIINIRLGTAGSTADTARCTLTFGAGTAVADTGLFEVRCTFRTVGSGTSGVLQAISRLVSNLTTTGLSNAKKAVLATSSGFDTTVSGLGIGASYNGGTSAAHTIQLVRAELVM